MGRPERRPVATPVPEGRATSRLGTTCLVEGLGVAPASRTAGGPRTVAGLRETWVSARRGGCAQAQAPRERRPVSPCRLDEPWSREPASCVSAPPRGPRTVRLTPGACRQELPSEVGIRLLRWVKGLRDTADGFSSEFEWPKVEELCSGLNAQTSPCKRTRFRSILMVSKWRHGAPPTVAAVGRSRRSGVVVVGAGGPGTHCSPRSPLASPPSSASPRGAWWCLSSCRQNYRGRCNGRRVWATISAEDR